MNTLERVGPVVARKLVNLLGQQGAERIVTEVMPEIGLEVLTTPDERLRFGEALVARGGALAMVGRAIATQAILHGAIARIDALLITGDREK